MPPRHGLTAEYFYWSKPKETTKADLPTISKWQIGLFLWQKVARRDAQRAQQGRKPCTGRSRGAAPGAPLVTFPATGKSPGCRAERLHQGTLGLPAPHKVGRGAGRSARISGSRSQVWRLAPEGAQPLARAFGGKRGRKPPLAKQRLHLPRLQGGLHRRNNLGKVRHHRGRLAGGVVLTHRDKVDVLAVEK